MQIICTSFQTDNHAYHSILHRPDALTDAQPTNSVKALKATLMLFKFTLCGLTSRKLPQRSLGPGALVHEEARPRIF